VSYVPDYTNAIVGRKIGLNPVNYSEDHKLYSLTPRSDIDELDYLKGRAISQLHILFDADLLVYRAGFSASASQMEMLPLGIVTSRLDGMVQAAGDTILRELGYPQGLTVNVVMFLTGCEKVPNFREDVAPFYKAHRKDSSKPPYYQELRNYICDEYVTVMSEGVEADDYFGQAIHDNLAHDPNSLSVVVSIDIGS
jgi:hypothetical protein